MNEKILKWLPYIITFVVVVLLIVIDTMMRVPEIQDTNSLEEYARQLVESSEVMVNGVHYHGAYESEEVTTMPQGFEFVGVTNMISDDADLTNDLDAHVLPSGYNVYASSSDPSCVYIKITTDEEEIQQYIVYYKDITSEVLGIIE